ncbi:MAG: hypothetical protein ACM3JB_04550 [Acidobacteriaceae bacterium]
MQAMQYFLLSMTAILFVVAGFTFVHDLCLELDYRRAQIRGLNIVAPSALRWRVSITLALLAWIPFLLALGLAVMPLRVFHLAH